MKQAAPYSNTLIGPKSQGISPGHTVQLDWWWGAQQWLQEEQTGVVCENKLLYSRTAQGAVFNDIPSRIFFYLFFFFLPFLPHIGGYQKKKFQFDYGVIKYRLLKRG